jgi:hypothetical protein
LEKRLDPPVLQVQAVAKQKGHMVVRAGKTERRRDALRRRAINPLTAYSPLSLTLSY